MLYELTMQSYRMITLNTYEYSRLKQFLLDKVFMSSIHRKKERLFVMNCHK